MTRYIFTNAPESYDYNYCTTVKVVKARMKMFEKDSPIIDWRLVSISDAMRFENYQRPRYSSGLYTVVEPDSEIADAFELPKLNDIVNI